MPKYLDVATQDQMINAGQSFSYSLKSGDTVLLTGELGAGKTTFVRGILKGMGYHGIVVSPTFSLVESYPIGAVNIHHFDLYRLENERELELIGFRDYFTEENIVIIEWPQRVMNMHLPSARAVGIRQTGGSRQLSIE